MKISMVVYGTRGDVQPTLALALELLNSGHEVVIWAPKENEELVRSYHCSFIEFGTSIKDLFSVKPASTKPPATKLFRKFWYLEISKQTDQLLKLLKGSDLVIAVGFVFAVPAVCEYLKITYQLLAYYPLLLGASKNDSFKERLSWRLRKRKINKIYKGTVNKIRIDLGLNPVKDVWKSWMGDHVIVASFPVLEKVKNGVDCRFIQTGYMFLKQRAELTIEMETFLSSGTPPVFISFGSNPIHNAEKLSALLNDVAKTIKQRFIISKGWANLEDFKNTRDCLFVDDVPFELLFPRVALVVHHGGTGTMASAAKEGIPQIAFPYMADQFQNQKQIVKLGLGPNSCHFKKMSAQALSNTISECLSNKNYKTNAENLLLKINEINGTALTLKAINDLLINS
jgi:vancomycin aglycone glucosyltransferase